MHGTELLESPVIGIIIISIGLVFVALSIRNRNSIRDIQYPKTGHKIIDTSREWVYFSIFFMLFALGVHLIAEYSLHWYEITKIDNFTHGFSGMAITALILNFNFTRKRRYYYSAAIGNAIVWFVVWEIFEALYVLQNPSGPIQINNWDTAVDLWIGFLGALAVCFLCDEMTNEENPDK